jgi:hypothetical protein
LEAYQALARLFEAVHIDNMKILRALFYTKDEHPLIDGTTKKRVGVDMLRRKIVMLFVSDLDISHEELFVLIQIYNDTHGGQLERRYEVVWLPIVDRHRPWDSNKYATNKSISCFYFVSKFTYGLLIWKNFYGHMHYIYIYIYSKIIGIISVLILMINTSYYN